MGDEQQKDSTAPASSGAEEQYLIQLPIFEGPLDLLLHLIREHKVDILDIPVSFVTQKYLEYLELMRVLNLDVAAEYLLMAATLTHLKSKMLLPKEEGPEEEEEDVGDPRAELVRRLLEYQKYKDAAFQLSERSMLYRDVFPRTSSPEDVPTVDAPLAEVNVFQLLAAFDRVLKRLGNDLRHEVGIDRLSVSERIQQLVDRLSSVEHLDFEALFDGMKERHLLVVTFLALLEMARLRMVRLTQEELRGAILVSATGVAEAGSGEDSFSYDPLSTEEVPAPTAEPLTPEEQALVDALEREGGGEEENTPEP